MNLAQKCSYWSRWQRCAVIFAAQGMARPAIEEKRHTITERALGYDKSMSDWRTWKNTEVDKVFAAFAAVYDGGNLDAQLHAIEQPEQRRNDMIARCYDASFACITQGDDAGYNNDLAQRYREGVARKMFGVYFRDLDDKQLAKVMGALERSARVKERVRAAKAQRAAAGVDDGEPF